MTFVQQEQQLIFQTYKRFPLFIQRGEGVWVWDEQGKKYLDFLAGIAVNALGHCHPAIVQAAQRQLTQLGHTSNLYYTQSMLSLAQRLVSLSNLEKVFYANSGAEANEAAIKLARKYHPEKFEIICCHQSFHGRTLATITATGQPKYQKGFEPLVPGFKHVAYNNLNALETAISEQTASIFLEPIQGEGGVIIPDENYLKQVRELCDQREILLVLDEVQTGCGRTGKFFAYEHSRILPDIVTLAKALGGGLPIGVCLAKEKVAAAFQFGDHASTFGGHPVSCAAALAFLDTIESDNLLARCQDLGALILARLKEHLHDTPIVKEIRGKGLMIGIELHQEVAGEVVLKCQEKGLLIGTAGSNVVRMLPPLIISESHVEQACEVVLEALQAV